MRQRFEWPHSTAGVVLLLGSAVLLAYANSFAGLPQFDDHSVIFDEPRVASLGAWWDAMPGMRPLLKLSYALNRSGGGLAGFHLANLAIHLGCVLLAWQLFLRLVPANAARAALLGALLFALHPANTEAVTLLNGRSVSLSTLAMLGSLVVLLDGRIAVSLLLFALALSVRETAIALPALAALCVASRGSQAARSHGVLREALWRTRWHWALAMAAVPAMLAVPRYRELLAFSLELRSPLANLVTQAGGAAWLLGEWLWPFTLNADPRLPVFASWDLRWVALCSAWCTALAWSLARVGKGSWFALALLWFVCALAPSNSVIARLDIANDRQLYLAALPLYLLVALECERLRAWAVARSARSCADSRLHGALAQLLPVLVAVTLFATTALRNRDYHSEAAFWSAVLARDAQNARAWNNLGYALEREQAAGLPGAVAAYTRAIELDPADYKPRHNLRRLCAREPMPAGCEPRPAP